MVLLYIGQSRAMLSALIALMLTLTASATSKTAWASSLDGHLAEKSLPDKIDKWKHVEGDLDGACSDDTLCSSENENASELHSESSLLDFLDPTILEDEVLLDEIKSKLLEGRLVVIQDAFKPEFAEFVHSQISSDDVDWTREQHITSSDGIQRIVLKDTGEENESLSEEIRSIIAQSTWESSWQRVVGQVEKKSSTNSRIVSQLQRMLAATGSRTFMHEKICTRSCMGSDVEVEVNEHNGGDYSTYQNGFAGWRSVNMIWQLSKDWDSKWGGAFFWGQSKTMQTGYHYPTFNSLVLYIPTPYSTFYVTPVSNIAKGRLLSVDMKYTTHEDTRSLSIDDPLEEKFGGKEMLLTAKDAAFIVNMDTGGVDLTEERKGKLTELKESVENYLNPYDDWNLVIEGNAEDSDTPLSDLSDFTIDENPSMFDYINIDLDDEMLLDKIRTQIIEGKVVTIKNAFKSQFAEHMWQLFNSDDIDWIRNREEKWKSNYGIDGHRTFKNVSSKQSFPEELMRALKVFEHQSSRALFEDLSGRSCAGRIAAGVPAWYRVGDFSSPHTDFLDDRTLSFVWHAAKDHHPSFGGSFVWFPSKTPLSGYSHASFNTLYLFLPNTMTSHVVTPVNFWTTSRRFSIQGWYTLHGWYRNREMSLGQLTDFFNSDDDAQLNKLTLAEAEWIARDMDVILMTDDSELQRKLDNLKNRVWSEYLYPTDSSALLIDGQEEEVED